MLMITAFQVQVSSFQAVYQGADIRLEWKVSEESEVTSYEISRKKETDGNYSKLADVAQSSLVITFGSMTICIKMAKALKISVTG